MRELAGAKRSTLSHADQTNIECRRLFEVREQVGAFEGHLLHQPAEQPRFIELTTIDGEIEGEFRFAERTRHRELRGQRPSRPGLRPAGGFAQK